MITTTTLNEIRSHNPCECGWKKLLSHLGKTKGDDEHFPISTVLQSNGLNDCLWVLAHINRPVLNRFALQCAQSVEHLMEDPRSVAAYADAADDASDYDAYAYAAAAAAAYAADDADADAAAAYAAASYGAAAAAADAADPASAYDAADDAALYAARAYAYAAAYAAAADPAAADDASAYAYADDASSAAYAAARNSQIKSILDTDQARD